MQQLRSLSKKFIPILLLTIILLVSCTSHASTPTVIPSLAIAETLTQTLIPTVNTPTPEPSPTTTLIPVIPNDNAKRDAGVIIFAMEDGKYRHLFAYNPSYLPVTRLTDDAWDFNYPAISPDGNRIAFCANQFGRWDIFILDLNTTETIRLTHTDGYACAPAWSPDGQWLAYEKHQNGHSDIILQGVDDLAGAPIQLTENAGNNFNPSWLPPEGRTIAFVTDRSGRGQIWLADLNNPDDRFTILAQSDDADYSSPAWSPDGSSIAWSKTNSDTVIEVKDLTDQNSNPRMIGSGTMPVWLPNGTGLLAQFTLPTSNYLTAYNAADSTVLLPAIRMSGVLSSYDWKAQNLSDAVENYLNNTTIDAPVSVVKSEKSNPDPVTGRYELVLVNDLDAPEPYLSDAVDGSFKQLRSDLSAKLGWDFLGKLESAALPATTAPQAGIPENWLYTGRAFAANLDPLEAGWMVASREEFDGKNYWRIWLKCLKQDGTCGAPLRVQTWDFQSRYSGDAVAREEGGKISNSPEGYWIDFTEFAFRYGWERVPSMSNWRAYFPGIQVNIFVNRQSLSWKELMLQLYPAEMLSTFSK